MYDGKFVDADIKTSRRCPCGEAEVLKKVSRSSTKSRCKMEEREKLDSVHLHTRRQAHGQLLI